MTQPFDPPRQSSTPGDNPVSQSELSKYTLSVADAVVAFHEASMSITDRTVQRYCHNGKLRAVRVDPDTRQKTDKDNYVFLIDPTSIPERVAQLLEKQEFSRPTVVASGRDTSGHDATSRDVSEDVASDEDTAKTNKQSAEESDELTQLREKVMSLEIDKRVRDGLLDQMRDDRRELLSQLQGHVETITSQSRLIGQLETRLELDGPVSERDPVANAGLVIEASQPDRIPNDGDKGANYQSQTGV